MYMHTYTHIMHSEIEERDIPEGCMMANMHACMQVYMKSDAYHK